jgi:dTDP-4-amino-4,6-dideoxygalactose transaminase
MSYWSTLTKKLRKQYEAAPLKACSILSRESGQSFTTFKGGVFVYHDEATKKRIDFLKNFGLAGKTTVVAPGINAKINEFQSALGILQLNYVDDVIEKRKAITQYYPDNLSDLPGIRHCYPYFPILVDYKSYGKTRDQLYEEFKKYNVFTRRYFYPLISQFLPTEGSNRPNLVNCRLRRGLHKIFYVSPSTRSSKTLKFS